MVGYRRDSRSSMEKEDDSVHLPIILTVRKQKTLVKTHRKVFKNFKPISIQNIVSTGTNFGKI